MKGSKGTISHYINNLFIIALVLYILLYLLSTIWEHPIITETQSIMAMIMLLTTLLVFPKRGLLLPILLITISIIIVVSTSSSPIALWIGLREMNAIITLVILIGLVSWMISHRPYVKALMLLGKKKITTPTRFYSLVTSITHLISSFMTVGGIPFSYQMFQNMKKPHVTQLPWDFTLSTAVIRGFSLTVLWTAVHPAFAYVVGGTNAPLFPTMFKGLGLAMIGMALSIGIFSLQKSRKKVVDEVIPDLTMNPKEHLNGLVGKFLFWVSLLMGGIFITHHFLKLDILLAVPLVVVVVTTLYFISNRALPQYKKQWFTFVAIDFGKKKREIFLMLSAGILVGTLKETGYGHDLFLYFLTIVEWLNLNILMGLTLVVILLGFCGFPPIPAMVLLSGILIDIPGGYAPELVALSLLLGVSVTLFVAPVTVPLLLLASLNGRSLSEVGLRWNIIFGIIFLVIGLVYIQGLAVFS
ncbi:hypothetical protein JOC85_003525 [Bacillus mesophilus]|uniref:Uncharacterized protein n=1 Tax=Bacillus mesophilus TaxID=1808955 RepID=A0A6M0QAA6_9BACI|nr:hypothetical protein [Bacillus mesophilus]MBM7662715.1 hypothetical protein [Bacillus mesophilus]NEY73223.1 hypothetical protein [Bacillus mesophilus]